MSNPDKSTVAAATVDPAAGNVEILRQEIRQALMQGGIRRREIARALGVSADALAQFLAGANVTPERPGDADLAAVRENWPNLSAAVRRALAGMARNAAKERL